MKVKKYYVVWNGRIPGIYESWNECKSQVDGFENAKYKSFESLSASVPMASGSPDSFTCAMRLSMASSNLLTSSGRLMLLAARASFHPPSVHHLETD